MATLWDTKLRSNWFPGSVISGEGFLHPKHHHLFFPRCRGLHLSPCPAPTAPNSHIRRGRCKLTREEPKRWESRDGLVGKCKRPKSTTFFSFFCWNRFLGFSHVKVGDPGRLNRLLFWGSPGTFPLPPRGALKDAHGNACLYLFVSGGPMHYFQSNLMRQRAFLRKFHQCWVRIIHKHLIGFWPLLPTPEWFVEKSPDYMFSNVF